MVGFQYYGDGSFSGCNVIDRDWVLRVGLGYYADVSSSGCNLALLAAR